MVLGSIVGSDYYAYGPPQNTTNTTAVLTINLFGPSVDYSIETKTVESKSIARTSRG